MWGEWTTFHLGNVCVKIGSGATPRGGSGVYLERGAVALIRSQNIYNDGFRREGLVFITSEHAAELEHVEVLPGDVLLNITGDSVARCCEVDALVLPARVNQHVAIVRPDLTKLDPRFLRYCLVSPEMQRWMLSLAGSGGTRNALTKGMIESFAIVAPEDIPEQRAIARILGALDDKIDLNRRMNDTLQAVARAIFKSWFVDFDPVRAKAEGRQPAGMDEETAALFPDAFQDSPLGKIPKRWNVRGFGEVIELAYGKALKEADRRVGPIPVYGSNGRVGWHDEKLVDGPGIIVGRKGNPGIVTWSPTAFFAIDTTFYVIPKGPVQSMHYLFHAIRLQDLKSLGADSAVPGLNRNIVYMNSILVPPPGVLASFDINVRNLYNKIHANDEETRTLAAVRDALLPKLLSGAIRVKEAEQVVERVV
jgi:type I restriction enzyme S subunit